jgi:hypothetical protein
MEVIVAHAHASPDEIARRAISRIEGLAAVHSGTASSRETALLEENAKALFRF